MRRVFPAIAILLLLSGCDAQPPKPKAVVSLSTATVIAAGEVNKSLNQPDETDVLQQKAYVSLARGELLSACQHTVLRHAFEEAVCRQQRQVGTELLSDTQAASPKPSTVLNKRDDKRNPWQWLAARETCWSADCLHAQRVRTVVKRCGAPAVNALQGSCVHGEIVW